ncbi:MAG: Ig-like domain-containing protein [Anaeromyxobacter sp.]
MPRPHAKPAPNRRALVLLALLAAACGSEQGPDRAPPEEVVDVQIDPAAVTLDVGEQLTLAALVTTSTTEPARAALTDVEWASLSTAVATVAADGTVLALAPGTARVTATAGGITGQALVTVREPDVEPGRVASVELSETAVTLEEGAARALVATPRDAQGGALDGLPVGWRTSDEGVVYVTAGGELRAVRAGSAEVTATVHGVTATAVVTVTLESAWDLFFEAWSEEAARFRWITRDLRDPAAGNAYLMAGSTVSGAPVPSPSGDRIAFAISSPLSPQNQLRVVDLQRQTVWFVALPGMVVDVAWSWEGDRLAFALSSDETGYDVWTIRADGTGPVNVTAILGTSDETQPTWAPGPVGKLAFTRAVGGVQDIWTMDAVGTNLTRLTTGGADADPAWSPDGTSIVFQRSGAALFGDLFFVSPATGAVQRSLVGVPGIQARPAWSPDGRMVAFTSGGDVYTVRTTDAFLARRTFDGEATVELRPGWLKRR